MAGNLGHLAATVSLNIDPFKTSARTLAATIKSTTAQIKAQDAAFKGSEKSVAGMKTQYATLSQQAKNYEAQLKQQKKNYDDISKSMSKEGADFDKLSTRQANAASTYNKTAAKAAELNNRMSALRKEIALQSSGWTKASVGAQKFATVTGGVGEKLSSFGNKMMIGVTAPIAAGFVKAAKSAVDFNSQIDNIGPLLTNGGAITAKFRAQLDQMAASSKKWAVQYGVSTASINSGMEEMVKRGYTAQQTMGAMPAVLDAAKASGDDFNDVMHVSTSVLEQFGLKSNTTAGMLKNTSRVTDGLTLIANKTAAGFQDMGEAMTYVGPSAHAAGISLEETAAAIGLMSNQGIEGSVAGTALRGALTRLMKPSKQNIEGFQKLGISVGDFKKGTLTLPEILDKIKNNTKGWTDAQRASAIATAFGTEAQAGMNVLVSEGGDALRGMTNDAKNAAGTTAKIAESMNNTQAAKVAKFKESLNVLAITVGQKLLPTLTPLIDKATQVITAFSKMDSSTQQSIIKWALFAAAIAPVSKSLGAVFKVASGGASAFSAVAGGLGRASAAAKVGATGFDVVKSAFSKTAFEALKVAPAAGSAAAALGETGAAAGGAAAGAGGLLASMAPLGVGLVAVAGAAAVGYGAWELWGKKAYESSQRTQEWGTDIGAAADQSASKMKTASGEIAGALDNTTQSSKTNSKTIVNGFNDMTSAAEEAAKKSDTAAKKLAKSLGGDAGEALTKAAAKEKAANDKRIKQMQDNAKQAEAITRAANKSGEKLTADQIQVLDNLRQDSAAKAVKTLKLSGSEQNNVLKAVLGEKVKMSQASAEKQYTDMQNALQKEYQANTAAQEKIKNSQRLSTADKNAALEGLEKDHQAKLDTIYKGAIQAMEAQGQSRTEILQNLSTAFDLTDSQAKSALASYEKTMQGGVNSTKQFAAAVSDNMSKSVKKAGNDWNSLVLDPKTGKVKTNLAKVLADTASTKSGWSRLTFDLKNAKINSNAKQTIVEALAASDQWKSLPTWEKDAIIKTQGREELSDVMLKFMNWDQFDLKQQQAIVTGDYTPLVDGLAKSGQWNDMTLKEQQAVVHDKATPVMITALQQTGEWDKLPMSEKSAIVNAKGTVEVSELAYKYEYFDELPEATKKAALEDAGFRDKIEADNTKFEDFNALPPATQKAILQDSDFRMKLAETSIKYHDFYKLPDSAKKALMDDKDVRQKLIAAGLLIDKYNLDKNPKPKTATADTANVQNNFGLGTAAVNKYKKANPGKTKVGKGDTKSTQSAMQAGDNSIEKYKNTDPGATKVGKGNTNSTQSSMNAGTKTVKNYRNASTGPTKHGTASFSKPGYSGTMSAIGNFNSKRSSKKSFISEFISIFTKKNRATGDSNFSGGLVTVNDAPGTIFREMITLPTGERFSPIGRFATLALPKHARIETAAQTHARYNIPQFASGTGDFKVANRINSVAPVQVQSTSSSPSITFDTTALVANQQLQIATMQQQNGLLSKMVQLLASSSGSPTSDAVRRLMQQMNTATNQIGRGRLS